jgi:uncharacterized damage-inducible protein DinB
VTWTAPDVERSEDYPARRNEPQQEMLRDWLDWHRATLLRKCARLDATQLAKRAVPPSNLSLLGLVRHLGDAERGWVRQTFRGEQIPDLYYRSDAPDADIEEADPASAAEDFERYQAECRAVDTALEGAELDDTFTLGEKTISVRWDRTGPVRMAAGQCEQQLRRHDVRCDVLEVSHQHPRLRPGARTGVWCASKLATDAGGGRRATAQGTRR